jgi:phosphatidylserine decarboxylase
MSRLMGYIARRPFSRRLIPLYIRYFDIDMEPVKKPLSEFENLVDFFVRAYREEARPIDFREEVVVSPVDGTISQCGMIEEGRLFQAKGHYYSLTELLGETEAQVKPFYNGQFMTIYLSPRDYHRIHIPVTGGVEAMTYIPGELYPVNQWGVQKVPRLFSRNERLVTHVQSPFGRIALVKVGATNVGSIKVVYDQDIVTNRRKARYIHKVYPEAYSMSKGAELGRFEFGSTVILLFEPQMIDWVSELKPGKTLRMGQPIAWRKTK